MTIETDELGRKIMRELVKDARISHVLLSERVGLSPTACARRVQQLEESGVIRGYTAEIDATGLGFMMTVLLRMAAARTIKADVIRAAPGGFTIAVLWQFLQHIGTIYVTHITTSTESNHMTGTFGVVLGLMGLLYIAAIMGMLGIEVNVVLARRLWPRALLTPFTDRVDLTDADRRAYAMYTQMQRHKGFQTVTVRFDGRDGDTHEIVLDPKTERVIKQHIHGKPPRPEANEPPP